MTVSTTTNKVSYIGNGVAVEFAIPFPFLETNHLKVFQLLNDIQTQREDWTIQNGNVIFETPPALETQIVIMREVPLTQETDYQENEILAAETLERNFDKLTMQVQQLKEQADRAVTVDIFDDTQAAELLPNIRTAVSNAANYAQAANEKADDADQAAEIATAQATIATNKANEAVAVLSNKAEKDLSNCTRPYITETYHNGNDWYRVWSDGFIEQGGNQYGNGVNYPLTRTITFIKPFSLCLCSLCLGFGGHSAASAFNAGFTPNNIPSLTGFQFNGCTNGASNQNAVSWYACGF